MKGKARLLILLATVGLTAASIRGQSLLGLVSIGALLWIVIEWLQFELRVRLQIPRMTFRRTVNGRSDATGTLWAGRMVHVALRVERVPGAYLSIAVRDVAPEVLRLVEKKKELSDKALGARQAAPNELELPARWQQPEIRYDALALGAGQLNFPGVRLNIRDPFGFFERHLFVPVEQSFSVLPDYYQSGEVRPTVKRHNSLPAHGIHRLQRAGPGSELLELREYVAGDPPKSIAWKASARRDKLMTRQYESEVPVRVQIFVSGNISTRLGGYGQRLMDQMNYIAASVAKAATAVGDPVSGTLVDEATTTRLPWFTGDLGFLQFLKALSEFTNHEPPMTPRLQPETLSYAKAVIHERYPDLIDPTYLQTHFSLFRSRRERARLAAVCGELFQWNARQQAECIYDDVRMASAIQRLLLEAGLPWMNPLLPSPLDPAVEEASSQQSNLNLARSLSSAVTRARDNEVFVLLVDAQNLTPLMQHVLPIIKLAIAKHHRVALVCPSTTGIRPKSEVVRPESSEVADLVQAAEKARMRELMNHMKRSLAKVGASVSFSGERAAIQAILAEMELARDGRSTASSVLGTSRAIG